MSTSKAFRAIGSSLVVGLLVAFLAGSALAKATIIKIATLAPEGSTWIDTFDNLNAELKKKDEKWRSL